MCHQPLSLDDYVRLPYTIILIPDGDGWHVEIKELPGCMTAADDRDVALREIEVAKRLWIEAALMVGEIIPLPDYFDSTKSD